MSCHVKQLHWEVGGQQVSFLQNLPYPGRQKTSFNLFELVKVVTEKNPLPEVHPRMCYNSGGRSCSHFFTPVVSLKKSSCCVCPSAALQGAALLPGQVGRRALRLLFPPAQHWAVESDKMQAALGRRFRLLGNFNKALDKTRGFDAATLGFSSLNSSYRTPSSPLMSYFS